jgi:iron complex outermembrane recepter protein
MKTTTLLFFSFLFSFSIQAATIRGTVKDATGQPLAGATVAIENVRTAITDIAGAFAIDVPAGEYVLRVTSPGFATNTRRVQAGNTVDVALDPAFAESMVVAAIRADAATPVTKTDIDRVEIERQYHGQDVPLLLRETPSIHAYSESGVGGAGYSYISMRGVSPTRINFTLDGVPLADSEDFGTYFADFPDLARSMQSIQVQRGVGTSTVGSPSFGGSVNLQSIDLSQDQRTTATLAGGSFGNRQASVGWQSGLLANGVSLYTRLSYLESDGYRDNSAMRQRNLFVSAAKTVGAGQLKLTGFSGHEEQQLSFFATELETLRTNPRANPLTPEEKDQFAYDLAQLQYVRPLGDDSDVTASVYYQRGYGWYRLNGATGLQQFGLDGRLLGALATHSRKWGGWTINSGLHINHFKRDHTRDDLAASTRDYANYGVKREANVFSKLTRDRGPLHLYADMQVRYSDFDYNGDVDIESKSWTFFNPKLGARFDLSARSGAYASLGMSTREPTRNDLFLGQDNPSIAHDLDAVRPERVVDFELGWDYRTNGIEIAANVYAMEFRNEIAATGELSEIGLPLRRNVDRSSRRGIELDAAWQVTPMVRLRTIANVSRNRIGAWTQFYDVYDPDFSYLDSTSMTFRGVEPLLTPPVLVNQAIELTPTSRLSAGAVGRWAARSFLDNTNDLETPSYFVLDANVAYAVTPWARVSLQVNNLFDNDEIYASGYSYPYIVREGSAQTITGTSYFYPQATRNAVVMVDFDF